MLLCEPTFPQLVNVCEMRPELLDSQVMASHFYQLPVAASSARMQVGATSTLPSGVLSYKMPETEGKSALESDFPLRAFVSLR